MKRLNLKIKRIQKGLSQKELAERVGLTNQSISDYETGKLNPSYEVMKRISKELDSPVDELFFQNEKEEEVVWWIMYLSHTLNQSNEQR